MKVYVFSIEFHNNDTLEYSINEGVFMNKEMVKESATEIASAQARIWKTKPSVLHKKEGYVSVMVKHPTENIYKVYTIKEMEVK